MSQYKIEGKYIYVSAKTKGKAMDYLNEHHISFYPSTGKVSVKGRILTEYKFLAK